MDKDTLDFKQGAPVEAPEGDVGRLAHVVVDRASGAATGVVVSRHDGDWLVPIEAVAAANGRRVRLHGAGGPWTPSRFEDTGTRDLVVYRDGAGAAGVATAARAAGAETGTRAARGETERLRLREEELIPRKEVVQAGTVELRTEVVPSVRTLEVPVVRERVVVEHRPVEGVSPAPGPVGEDRTIVVLVREERVYVDKIPVVREEVAVGKRMVEETRRVDATARRERAVVRTQGDVEAEEEQTRPGD